MLKDVIEIKKYLLQKNKKKNIIKNNILWAEIQ
jgi:hypothetical protein